MHIIGIGIDVAEMSDGNVMMDLCGHFSGSRSDRGPQFLTFKSMVV